MQKCKLLFFTINTDEVAYVNRSSIIIEGIDGSGKSEVSRFFLSHNYTCIYHEKCKDKTLVWWEDDKSLRARMEFLIKDNIRIMQYMKENSNSLSERNFLSTIAIHSYFGHYDYEKIIESILEYCFDNIKWIFVDCVDSIRIQRLQNRAKLTGFDRQTMNHSYVEHYNKVFNAFSRHIPIIHITNSTSKSELIERVTAVYETL